MEEQEEQFARTAQEEVQDVAAQLGSFGAGTKGKGATSCAVSSFLANKKASKCQAAMRKTLDTGSALTQNSYIVKLMLYSVRKQRVCCRILAARWR